MKGCAVTQALRYTLKRFVALDGVIDEVRNLSVRAMKNSTLESADSGTLSDSGLAVLQMLSYLWATGHAPL